MNDDEILELIQQTADTQQKAMLLVLLKISNSLSDNTAMTRELAVELDRHSRQFAAHREEFARHVTDERELLARGIGAWKVVSLAAAIVFAGFGYVISIHLSDIKKSVDGNERQDSVIARNTARLDYLEAFLIQFGLKAPDYGSHNR